MKDLCVNVSNNSNIAQIFHIASKIVRGILWKTLIFDLNFEPILNYNFTCFLCEPFVNLLTKLKSMKFKSNTSRVFWVCNFLTKVTIMTKVDANIVYPLSNFLLSKYMMWNYM